MASHSRSRSPHQRASTGRTDKYTGSAAFMTWATDNLAMDIVNSPSAMNGAFKRMRRLTRELVVQLQSGADIDSPIVAQELSRFDLTLKPFARKSATNDMAKKEQRKKEQEKKEKDKKDKKAKKEKKSKKEKKLKKSSSEDFPGGSSDDSEYDDLLTRGADKPNESSKKSEPQQIAEKSEPQHKAEESKDPEKDPVKPNEVELTLALPSDISALAMALKNVQEAKDKIVEQEDNAIADLGAMEKKKKAFLIQRASMDKSIAQLTSAAKNVPQIKKQLELIKAQRIENGIESAKIEVGLNKARENIKTIRAQIKKLEKDESSVQALVHRDLAENQQDDISRLDEKHETVSKLEKIFEVMDRTSSGKVNKRDFIKAMEDADVALFFGLPSKIMQEDGSREQMEAVFQKIAIDGSEFDLEELKVYGKE